MTTRRKDIRHAVRDLLGTADADGNYPTNVGEHVYATRMVPVDLERQDVIAVYTFDDQIDDEHGWEPDQSNRRLLTLAIEIITGGEDADDRLDDLTEQVEAVLAKDPQLTNGDGNPRTEQAQLQGLEVGRPQDYDRILIGRMTWLLPYWTVEPVAAGSPPSQVLLNVGEPFGYEGYHEYEPVAGEDVPAVEGNPIPGINDG